MFGKSIILILILIISKIQSDCISVKQKIENARIVPDLIDVAPSLELCIRYHARRVKFGNELTPTETQYEPCVKWPTKADKYYLLMLVDPDLPANQTAFIHWLVGNIWGFIISTGDPIAEYLGPKTPKNDGLHRYVFLLYEQKGLLNFDSETAFNLATINRIKFSVRNFTKVYSLGSPIAGNYFLAQWDEFVGDFKPK